MQFSVFTLLSLAAVLQNTAAFPVAIPVALPNFLVKRQYSSSTYNQLTDGTACRPVTLIYARGTTQAGNVGDSAAVGPLFFNNLASRLGGTSQLAIQGVTYPANVQGFLAGGDAAGSATLASLVAQVRNLPHLYMFKAIPKRQGF
jgi:cutinase